MSSIIPNYEYDVFISYRQKDNRSDQWVTNFVNSLKEELDATFKEDISIYFDENPHDGLQETHDVDDSLKEKVKCLVFIPIVSQTYCDPNAFAWQKEFLAFLDFCTEDEFGLNVKLGGGNVTKRVLPVRIHEIDEADKNLFEEQIGGIIRPIDFVYKSSGVNRPLQKEENDPSQNLNHTFYRDQTNKVANAIKEIIGSMKSGPQKVKASEGQVAEEITSPKNNAKIIGAAFLIVVLALISYYFLKSKDEIGIEAANASIAVIPFLNNTGNSSMDWYGLGLANEIRTQLSLSKQFDFISSMQATIVYKNSQESPESMGKKLGATHLLTGVYQPMKDQLQVLVELVESSSGKVLWSLPFVTNEDELGTLQASIAEDVIRRFDTNYKVAENTVINPQAMAELTKGNEILWSVVGKDVINSAINFQNAIKLDSGMEQAWVGLVKAYCRYDRENTSDSAKAVIQSIIQQAENRFGNSLSVDVMKASFQYYVALDYNRAKSLFQKVLEHDPDDLDALFGLSVIYKRELDFAAALEVLAKVLNINSSISSWAEVGLNYQLLGDYENAQIAFRKVLDLGSHSNQLFRGVMGLYIINSFLLNKVGDISNDMKKIYGDGSYNYFVTDSLLFARDFRELLKYLRTIQADSLFGTDPMRRLKMLGHYILKEDDSVQYYFKKYSADTLSDNPEFFMMALEAIPEEIENALYSNASTSLLRVDAMTKCNYMVAEIRALALGNYKQATLKLIELNKAFPKWGNYLFLNDPIFDRIKDEYPPFQEAIDNLKLPPLPTAIPELKR